MKDRDLERIDERLVMIPARLAYWQRAADAAHVDRVLAKAMAQIEEARATIERTQYQFSIAPVKISDLIMDEAKLLRQQKKIKVNPLLTRYLKLKAQLEKLGEIDV